MKKPTPSDAGRQRARILFAAAISFFAETSQAYRPFESTDADVTDAGELEIELGYFTFERSSSERTLSIPQSVFNYGLTDSLELVGEFEVTKPEHDSGEFADAGLFLKKLVRRGTLQEEAGLSVAIEGGLLLPTHGEEQVGLEAIGIVSHGLGRLTYHINFGAGIDRTQSEPFGVWGGILEYPLGSNLTVAGEIAGEKVQGEQKEISVLLGLIWESPSTGNTFDGGLRRGISSAAPDWELTLGWTFSFPRQ